jgi:hypothetical protein
MNDFDSTVGYVWVRLWVRFTLHVISSWGSELSRRNNPDSESGVGKGHFWNMELENLNKSSVTCDRD